VKNCTLIVDVSEGFMEDEIKMLLTDFGLKKVKDERAKETRVYVNGNLVGLSDNPEELVHEIRGKRRIGALSHEVNIRFDERMNEILINSDEGRLRRPLLVVENGRLLLTRKHLEGLKCF
jgi:DNA-directed RNA polymerase subunit B